MDESYDLVVVGSGPAGQVAAELAASFGRRVLVVEQNKPGGVVTTTGGAPTKALREAALYLTGYRQEEVYGVRAAAPLEVVLPTLRARVEWVRDILQDVVADRLAGRGISLPAGDRPARDGPHRPHHLPRMGWSARWPPARSCWRPDHARPTRRASRSTIPTSTTPTGSTRSGTAPKDIVIVGGGAVGVEFASAFTALGAAATLVSLSDRLLPTLDGELAGLLADEFERRGVRVVLGAGAERVGRVDGRLCVTLSTGDVLAADAVLFAAGRTPNTAGLGLEEAGVRLDGRGRIVVDHYYRTSAAGIYAAGDVVRPGLASNAMQQGRAAAAHACGLVFGVVVDQIPSAAVYGVPEVAGVGATEEEVSAAGVPYVVGRCDLGRTARGAIAGHGGLLKLIFRADDRKLLGVHCFGDIASEVVGLGQVVLHVGASVELFLTLALNTPTYSYAYHDAAIDGLTRLTEVMGLADGANPAEMASAGR